MTKYKLHKELLHSNMMLTHIFLTCCNDLCIKIANNQVGMSKEEIDNLEIEFDLKINGVDVDPEPFFKMFNDQHTDCIRNAAIEIIKEKFSERFNTLYEKVDELEMELTDQISYQIK